MDDIPSFWNTSKLSAPATCSVPYTLAEQTDEDAVSTFQTVVEVMNTLTSLFADAQASLNTEHYILRRIIYKANNQFRYEKRLQIMKRIEKCIKRNAALAIDKYVLQLQDTFPGKDQSVYEPRFSSKLYVPSLQMYEYLLTKIIGSVVLLNKGASLCMDGFICVKQVLAEGFFYMNSSVLAANLSRLWVLCRYLARKYADVYRQLRSVIYNLQSKSISWLPPRATLPICLDAFFSQEEDHKHCDNIMATYRETEEAQMKLLNESLCTKQNSDTSRQYPLDEDMGIAVKRKVLSPEKHTSQILKNTGTKKQQINNHASDINVAVTAKKRKFCTDNNSEHGVNEKATTSRAKTAKIKKIKKKKLKAKCNLAEVSTNKIIPRPTIQQAKISTVKRQSEQNNSSTQQVSQKARKKNTTAKKKNKVMRVRKQNSTHQGRN